MPSVIRIPRSLRRARTTNVLVQLLPFVKPASAFALEEFSVWVNQLKTALD
jgi:hypothetical protein